MILQKTFRITVILILAALLSGSFISCSPERNLARRFIALKPPANVMLIAPEMVFKKGYKLPDSVDMSKLSEHESDSVLFFQTRLLQFTKDSLYISSFVEGMVSALHNGGIQLFTGDSTMNFVHSENPGYIVHIAQLQLEEYYDSLVTAPDIFNNDADYVIYYTAVNMNTWLELSRMNSQNPGREVLFNSKTAQDYVDGSVRYIPISGDYKFITTIDSLSVDDLYELAGHVGYVNGNLLFNYMMNAWIRQHMTGQNGPIKMFSYNPLTGDLKRSNKSGFTPLKN